MPDPLLLILAGVAIFLAALSDLRTREVPDWLNIGLIFSGIGVRLIFSIMQLDAWPIVIGLAGLGLAVIISYAMFYAGQWGGGDAKLLMGLGAVLGLDPRHLANDSFIAFLVNALIVGGFYGLLWCIGLAIKHRHAMCAKLSDYVREKRIVRARRIMLASTLLLIGIAFMTPTIVLQLTFLMLSFGAFLLFYLWIFARVVERVAMHKHVDPEKLTEGDWIAYDVVVDGKRICGPKDLGVSKEQIKELIKLKKKKLIKTVLIKEGIPFVPSFFIAYIITVLWGSLLMPFLVSLG